MSHSGTIVFGSTGAASRLSPSIWGDCPQSQLNELGTGYYIFNDFLAAPPTFITGQTVGGNLQLLGDAATVSTGKAAELGGYADFETDGDDNDAWALVTEPIAKIDLHSGNKFWFEARVEIGAVADQGFYVGMVEEAGQGIDVIADDAGATIGESNFGFRILATDTDAFDAVYKLDAGTEVEVLADVTNATAIDSADRASVAADTEVKLGMRFDGATGLEYYVNGIKVATATLATSTFPDGVNMCGVINLKTGAAAAVSAAIDWVAIAYKDNLAS